MRTIDVRPVLLLLFMQTELELTEKERERSKMNEPMQLEEYIRESKKFSDAAHKFMDAAHKSLKDTARLNYYKLSEACKSHQHVTANACAFALEVIETRDGDLDEKHRSQLQNYINVRTGPLPSLKEEEKEPNIDIHALKLLQQNPELVRQFERTPDLELCLAELASTLEKWYVLYRKLYSIVFRYGYPI